MKRVYRRVDADGETVDYVAVFDVAGRQHKKVARTFTAAKRLKLHGGDQAPERLITFLKFLDEWVERYRGQGRRGFRDQTREEYRRLIRTYAHPLFLRRSEARRREPSWPGSSTGSVTRRSRGGD